MLIPVHTPLRSSSPQRPCSGLRVHHRSDRLPRRAGRDVFPPSAHMLAGGDSVALLGHVDEVKSVRNVREISQAEEIACQVLVLRQMCFVDVQNLLQFLYLLLDNCLVALLALHWSEHQLVNDWRYAGIVVLRFNLQPLIDQGLVLGSLSEQWCTLRFELVGNVPCHGARLCDPYNQETDADSEVNASTRIEEENALGGTILQHGTPKFPKSISLPYSSSNWSSTATDRLP